MTRFKLIFIVPCVIYLLGIKAEISDKRLCANKDCSEPISTARALLNYRAAEKGMLSFGQNEVLTIYSKAAGRNMGLWGAELKGKRGYIPIGHVREEKVFTKNLSFLAETESVNKEVPSDNPVPTIKPDKPDTIVVDGTTIYNSDIHGSSALNETTVVPTALPLDAPQTTEESALNKNSPVPDHTDVNETESDEEDDDDDIYIEEDISNEMEDEFELNSSEESNTLETEKPPSSPESSNELDKSEPETKKIFSLFEELQTDKTESETNAPKLTVKPEYDEIVPTESAKLPEDDHESSSAKPDNNEAEVKVSNSSSFFNVISDEALPAIKNAPTDGSVSTEKDSTEGKSDKTEGSSLNENVDTEGAKPDENLKSPLVENVNPEGSISKENVKTEDVNTGWSFFTNSAANEGSVSTETVGNAGSLSTENVNADGSLSKDKDSNAGFVSKDKDGNEGSLSMDGSSSKDKDSSEGSLSKDKDSNQGSLSTENANPDASVSKDKDGIEASLSKDNDSNEGTLSTENVNTDGSLSKDKVSNEGFLSMEKVNTDGSLTNDTVSIEGSASTENSEGSLSKDKVSNEGGENVIPEGSSTKESLSKENVKTEEPSAESGWSFFNEKVSTEATLSAENVKTDTLPTEGSLSTEKTGTEGSSIMGNFNTLYTSEEVKDSVTVESTLTETIGSEASPPIINNSFEGAAGEINLSADKEAEKVATTEESGSYKPYLPSLFPRAELRTDLQSDNNINISPETLSNHQQDQPSEEITSTLSENLKPDHSYLTESPGVADVPIVPEASEIPAAQVEKVDEGEDPVAGGVKEEVVSEELPGLWDSFLNMFGGGEDSFAAVADRIEKEDRMAYVESNDDVLLSRGSDHANSCTADPSGEFCTKQEKPAASETFADETTPGEESVLTTIDLHDLLKLLGVSGATVVVFLWGYIIIDKMRKEGPLIAKINNLEKALLVTTKENQILTEKMNESDVSVKYNTVSNEMIEELKLELESANSNRAVLEEQIQSLEKELENSTEVGLELNKMLSDVLSSQNGSDALMSNIEQLQNKLVEQQSTINTLNTNISEKETANHELQLELEINNKKVIDLQAELDKMVDNLLTIEEEKELAQNKHEAQVHSLKQAAGAAKQTYDAEISSLKNELGDVQRKLKETQRNLELKNNEYNLLKDNVKTIGSDNDIRSLLDANSIKAEMQQLQQEKMVLTEHLKQHQQIISNFENQVATMGQDLIVYREKYEEADREKLQVITKLDVLNTYFKEKEAEMQKEISKHESMWTERQGEASSTVGRIKFMQEEIQNFKAQNESLKQEIISQEVELKSQISVLEKKAHESWVAARQAERKLEDVKQEAATLRNRLTLRERSLNEDKSQNRLQSPLESNGEHPLSPLHMNVESPASPPLLFGTRDHLTTSPPLPGLPPFLPPPPGVPFIPPPIPGIPPFMPPPPSMFPGDHRPPPLGRMSSPPLNSRYSPDSRPYLHYDRNSPSPTDDEYYGISHRGYSPYNGRDNRRDYGRNTHRSNNKKGDESSGSGNSNDSLDKINRHNSKV